MLTQKTTRGAPAPGTQWAPQRPAPRHEQTEHGQGAEEQSRCRCRPAEAFSLHFNFTCMADSREDGCVLLQRSPFAEGSRVPSWTAKPAQGCVCWKRDQLPELFSAPCCPSPTARRGTIRLESSEHKSLGYTGVIRRIRD